MLLVLCKDNNNLNRIRDVLKLSSDEDDIHKCAQCNKIFPSELYLMRHGKEAHKEQNDTPRLIQVEDDMLEDTLRLLGVQRSPLGEARTVICTVCHKALPSEAGLNAHMKDIHIDLEERSPCPLCDEILASSSQLKDHIKDAHSHVQCETCFKRFVRQGHLEAHLNEVHKAGKSLLPCEAFSEAENLDNVKKVARVQKHTCRVCYYSFDTELLALKHYNEAHEKLLNTESQVIGRRDAAENEASISIQKDGVQSIEDRAEQHQGFDLLYQCGHCKKNFTEMTSLIKHKEDIHSKGARKHTCMICNATFPEEAVLVNHIHEAHREPFECDECEKIFASKEHLNMHKNSFHKDADLTSRAQHRCDQCSMTFSGADSLRKHEQDVHGPNGSQADSNEASEASFENETDREHSNMDSEGESDEKPTVYTCSECTYTFSNATTLQKHMNVKHSRKARPFQCSLCSKFYISQHQLNSHTRYVHLGEKNFRCQSCDKRYSKRAYLESHMVYEHGAAKKHACHQCEKKFATKQQLQQHCLRRHDAVKRSPCQLCPKSYDNSHALRRHMATCHGVKMELL